MKKLIYKSLFIGLFSLTFFNCTTSEIPLEEEPEPIVETIKYNNDVKSIIDANCIVCHTSGGQASFLPLLNYSQVKGEAEFGNLINRMKNATNPMPPSGKLSADKLAVIDEWKADGFLEN